MVLLAAMMARTMADRRGLALGLFAFVFFGTVFAIGVLRPDSVRRWSVRHPVLDSAVIVPAVFVALLLIPVLPWWGAAVLAVVVGLIGVPLMVRRRRAPLTRQPGRPER
ncbi:hypothetical protein Aoc01nite_21880 [Actinoplanes octamycinicus]|nr:hypothetical protein Aoc01nite_21880 [Actinoplanes octamycinicus]